MLDWARSVLNREYEAVGKSTNQNQGYNNADSSNQQLAEVELDDNNDPGKQENTSKSPKAYQSSDETPGLANSVDGYAKPYRQRKYKKLHPIAGGGGLGRSRIVVEMGIDVGLPTSVGMMNSPLRRRLNPSRRSPSPTRNQPLASTSTKASWKDNVQARTNQPLDEIATNKVSNLKGSFLIRNKSELPFLFSDEMPW